MFTLDHKDVAFLLGSIQIIEPSTIDLLANQLAFNHFCLLEFQDKPFDRCKGLTDSDGSAINQSSFSLSEAIVPFKGHMTEGSLNAEVR